MANTINLAQGLTADGDSVAVPIEGGQYLFAVSGAFGGGTVQIKVNVGAATGVPITGAAYTEAGAEVVWLPRCTVFVTLSDAVDASVNASLAELATRLERE